MKTFATQRTESTEQSSTAAPFCNAAQDEELTLLIVEDDPNLLSTLTYNLMRDGYRVLTASDGETGLSHARQEGARLGYRLVVPNEHAVSERPCSDPKHEGVWPYGQ
jgi:hypothetical protein